MCQRISHRVPNSLLTVDEVLDPRNWLGRSAEDLKTRLKAETLRHMVRLMGLKPPKRTANACIAAIVQYSADVQMGRADMPQASL